jgi:hypothetical protein
MKLPSGVKACLWSFDPSAIDLQRDRELIITQVLNYGLWRDVQWLLKTYPRRTIAAVLKNPSRGSWLPDVLGFWTSLWDIRLSRRRYQKALFILHP